MGNAAAVLREHLPGSDGSSRGIRWLLPLQELQPATLVVLVRILMQLCRDSLIAAIGVAKGMAVDGSHPRRRGFLWTVIRAALFVPIYVPLAGLLCQGNKRMGLRREIG